MKKNVCLATNVHFVFTAVKTTSPLTTTTDSLTYQIQGVWITHSLNLLPAPSCMIIQWRSCQLTRPFALHERLRNPFKGAGRDRIKDKHATVQQLKRLKAHGSRTSEAFQKHPGSTGQNCGRKELLSFLSSQRTWNPCKAFTVIIPLTHPFTIIRTRGSLEAMLVQGQAIGSTASMLGKGQISEASVEVQDRKSKAADKGSM